MSAALTNEEIARYSRHLILPEVGMEGQQKLKAASVLCVGTGGLGSPLLLYLAAAGVGRDVLRDADAERPARRAALGQAVGRRLHAPVEHQHGMRPIPFASRSPFATDLSRALKVVHDRRGVTPSARARADGARS